MPRVERQEDGRDVAIAYELRTQGAPAGPWLVLVHGLGYARWGWEPVVEPLAERFRVVVFDNRGIGESDVPAGPYTTGQLADDVVAILDHAGVDRAHVVATSLGGMAAQELAIAHPERVDRLVLVCTTPGGELAHPFPEPTRRLLEELPALPAAEGLERAVRNALSPDAPEELVERILAHRLAAPPDPAGWQAQAAAARAHDAEDRLHLVAAPTLVVHGTADVVVDPANAQVLAQRIPDARVVWIDGAGHLLFWEQPHAFTAAVLDFLGDRSVAGP